MFKLLLLSWFLCLQSALFSAPLPFHAFHETRYISALDRNVSLAGRIAFEGDNLVLEYSQPEKLTMRQSGDLLEIRDAQGEVAQQVDLAANPQMRIYLSLFSMLYRNDLTALATYFDIRRQGALMILEPKPAVAAVVREVRVAYAGEKIANITTRMQNGDVFTITIP